MSHTLEIAHRFNGPPTTGNGGYAAGMLVEATGGASEPITVSLKAPPPLGRPLHLKQDLGIFQLFDGEDVIMEASPGGFDHPVFKAPDMIDFDTTTRMSEAIQSFGSCFVCGRDRSLPDGLCLYSYPLKGSQGAVVAPWSLHNGLSDDGVSVATRYLVSALDCPGYFACASGEPALLARITVQILDTLSPDGVANVIG